MRIFYVNLLTFRPGELLSFSVMGYGGEGEWEGEAGAEREEEESERPSKQSQPFQLLFCSLSSYTCSPSPPTDILFMFFKGALEIVGNK